MLSAVKCSETRYTRYVPEIKYCIVERVRVSDNVMAVTNNINRDCERNLNNCQRITNIF